MSLIYKAANEYINRKKRIVHPEMLHCRSLKHICNLYNVDISQVKLILNTVEIYNRFKGLNK